MTKWCAVCVMLCIVQSITAGVVINEIMYHAPDDLDELQYVELYNPGPNAVDISGWMLARGARFAFPANTTLPADGYVVVRRDIELFKKTYGSEALGPFAGELDHGGDRVDLLDAKGKRIDSVKYRTRAPWPTAADGYSASLERICPSAASDDPNNWAPSPLAEKTPKPMGSPGRRNSVYAARPLPTISDVQWSPRHAGPEQAIAVSATIRSAKTVELRYRTAKSGAETEEQTLPMTKGAKDRYTATISGQKPGQIVRFRIVAEDGNGKRISPHENEVSPAFSVYVHEPLKPDKNPFGFVINVGPTDTPGEQRNMPSYFRRSTGVEPAPRGNSAYVHVKPGGEPELFDFINITPRGGGRKVRFHKDHQLDGMGTINLIFEGVERFILDEALSYEVYRKAGNAACRTYLVRTWIDGKPIGYQLLIEQPNRSFLRYNDLRGDGSLYKVIWYGTGLIGQHEKKTRTHENHDDLVKLVGELNKTKGDEQWEVIKKNFDVEQMINYYAVNMLLSHWDGYFNNYFLYHDSNGTGKWTMYPWDQDKAWGFYDGLPENGVFFNLPVTFGMAGDQPPGWPKGLPAPPGFGFGASWWRPGGFISKPLLANPRFRPLFLARLKELTETVYTEDVIFPLIKSFGERMEVEVRYQADLRQQNVDEAVAHLNHNLDAVREHVTKRRKFLLEQDEVKKAGKFERTDLK